MRDGSVLYDVAGKQLAPYDWVCNVVHGMLSQVVMYDRDNVILYDGDGEDCWQLSRQDFESTYRLYNAEAGE